MKKGIKMEPIWVIGLGGNLTVRSIFYRPDGTTVDKMLPVAQAKWHWEVVKDLVTREELGEEIIIDSGFITLPDLGEHYIAEGKPPLRYKWTSPLPMEIGEEKAG